MGRPLFNLGQSVKFRHEGHTMTGTVSGSYDCPMDCATKWLISTNPPHQLPRHEVRASAILGIVLPSNTPATTG
jgi:hypothetical protein